MEAELISTVLTMEETVFCYSIMKNRGFGTLFDSILPVYIDNA